MNRTPSPHPSPPLGERVPEGRVRGILRGSWSQCVLEKGWGLPNELEGRERLRRALIFRVRLPKKRSGLDGVSPYRGKLVHGSDACAKAKGGSP